MGTNKSPFKVVEEILNEYAIEGGAALTGPVGGAPNLDYEPIGLWDTDNQGALDRLNMYLAALSDRVYTNVYTPMTWMRQKLAIYGVTIPYEDIVDYLNGVEGRGSTVDQTEPERHTAEFPIRKAGDVVGMNPDTGEFETDIDDGKQDLVIAIACEKWPKGWRIDAELRKSEAIGVAEMSKREVNSSFSLLAEKAPPGKKAEEFIHKNKAEFKKKYGDEKGMEILYATAWKVFGDKD